jgi:hypothetical protein
MKRFKLITSFAFVGFFIYVGIASAQMNSTNYQIRWDTISTGGSDTSSSATYILRDSISSTAGKQATSASYIEQSGYRAGIFDQIITFDLFIQDTTSVKPVTAFAGNTVNTDTSGLAVDDYVVFVQDLGQAQISAMGRISSIGVGTITLDTIVNSGAVPVIDGTNDYLYQLDGNALAFDSLDTTLVKTGVIGFEVTSVNSNGYVVQVIEDGDFRTATAEIDDVSDGVISSGSEEYGAKSSDLDILSSTFDTEDTAITVNGQDVVSTTTAAYGERNFITLKAAIDSNTVTGNYAQTLTFIASGNF